MRRTLYSRLAASTGILFVALIATNAIIAEVKNFVNPGDLALGASNEVFGTVTLLTGFAAVSLFWFVSTFAARVRQLEGGSGRMAAAVNGSGAIIAGLLALSVSVMFATRSARSVGLGSLSTSILNGPALFFPAAVLVGAGGIVGIRARDRLPIYSRVLAMLAVPLGCAYLAGAGLMLFENYAWINDTGYITFLAFTLTLSVIGVVHWSEMDEPKDRPAAEETDEYARPPADVTPVRKPKPAARRAAAHTTTTRRVKRAS